MSSEAFLDRVSDLARIPVDEARSLIQRTGRYKRYIKEEAVNNEGFLLHEEQRPYNSLPDDVQQLIPRLAQLGDEQLNQLIETLCIFRTKTKQKAKKLRRIVLD